MAIAQQLLPLLGLCITANAPARVASCGTARHYKMYAREQSRADRETHARAEEKARNKYRVMEGPESAVSLGVPALDNEC